KAWAGVGKGQVVVDGLGNAHAGNGKVQLLRQLGHLVGCVLGIATAVVKKVANIVGLKDLDQSLVLGTMFFQGFEFVAAGAESARRCVNQASQGGGRFLADVQQVFGDGAQYA